MAGVNFRNCPVAPIIDGRNGTMAEKAVSVRIREATRKDIPALMVLNLAAYPVLAGDNIF